MHPSILSRMGHPQHPRRWTAAATLALLAMGCQPPEIRQITLLPTMERTADYGIVESGPVYESGHRVGILVSGMTDGSLAQQLGLMPGDVIVQLSGVPCDHITRCRIGQRLVDLALARRASFSIRVQRAGEPLVLQYSYQRPRNTL